MADENSPPDPSTTTPRRSSFAFGQTLTDLFPRPGAQPAPDSPPTDSPPAPSPSQPAKPSSMASAMAQQAQSRRRLSITTLGLSGTANPTSPFGTFRNRSDSNNSTGNIVGVPKGVSSGDESAVEDGPPLGSSGGGPSAGGSPGFGRRMSFGARAYRDNVRAVSGGSPPSSGVSGPNATAPTASGSPPNSRSSSGFNWSDTLRTRAERTSIAAPSGASAAGMNALSSMHNRTKSIADPQVPAAPAPPPAPKPAPARPDHFQERILKGDFYMD